MKKKDLKNYSKKLLISDSDFDLIVCKNLAISKSELFLLLEIPEKYIKNIKIDFEKRKNWVPIEYIIEKADFFSLEFFVDNRVLIPRNETEIIVEKVLELKENKNYNLIDIWTWSSAILLSLAKNWDFKNMFWIDISKKALEVAKINVEKYKLSNKIQLQQNNLLDFFLEKDNSSILEKNDLIITANLPYIKNSDFENMSEETIKFEPNLALFWWEKTGFELYEKLIFQIIKLQEKIKRKNIILFIEIGFDQKNIAENFLKKENLKFEIFKDNYWIYRTIKIYFDF